MKIKDLKLLLNEFPDDMEIVRDDGGMNYDRDMHFDVIAATVHPAELNNPTEYTIYYKENSDDYWNFQRVNTDVLLLY